MRKKQSWRHSHSSWISIADDYFSKSRYGVSALEDVCYYILLVKAVKLICVTKSAVRLAACTW